ncbi:MAG: hypothetical protein IH989_06890, partial [Planctomycetes bacterium]|nr:hypothetical protein [Planctomycetota bacterium]
ARFMRQDPFEFVPQFKLVIIGNHTPSIRNVDEGIRRRLHLVPFTVTIPREERDTDLLAKLSDRARTIFRRRRIGIIFQEYNLLPTLTVAEVPTKQGTAKP